MSVIFHRVSGLAYAIIILSILNVLPAYAGKLNDAAIIAIYNQVNSIDIETALLGQVRGHSKDVRKLATMVATDHTGVRKAVQDLAIKIGIVPTLPAARNNAAQAHYQNIVALRQKTGEEFDKAYLLHEIKFHTQAIKAVKEVLIPNTKNAELKKHFETVLPHFHHHLNETKRIAQKLKFVK